MKPSEIRLKLSLISKEFEILTLIIWALFFPFKLSNSYYLGFSLILIILLFKELFVSDFFLFNKFSLYLLLLNLIFIISIIFSINKYNSLLFYSDIFLISLWYMIIDIRYLDLKKLYNSSLIILTLFSLVEIINRILTINHSKSLFFKNSIFMGIVSSIGIIIGIKILFENTFSNKKLYVLIILINFVSMTLSQSKAAFLGLLFVLTILLFSYNKKYIKYLVLFVILIILIPNPIRSYFQKSLTKDPYVFDRLKIWNSGLKIIKDFPITGIGLNNFSIISPKYNFKQENEIVNYFKVAKLSHNDYLEILITTGIFGAIFLIFILIELIKKISLKKIHDINFLLLIYILFQAFFFNIIFNPFFLTLLFIILKQIFSDTSISLIKNNIKIKVITSIFLSILFILIYLIPIMINNIINNNKSPINQLNKLNKFKLIQPLDFRLYFKTSELLYLNFLKNNNIDSLSLSLLNIKKAQELNPYYFGTYEFESDIYTSILRKGFFYNNLTNKIEESLNKAIKNNPYNPFLRLKKAKILFNLGFYEKAKLSAINAIKIEKYFTRANVFLQENFHYFNEKEYNKLINKAEAYIKNHKIKKKGYIYNVLVNYKKKYHIK